MLFGSIAFLYVFAIGRRLADPLCGVAAALILFAHAPLLSITARGNNMPGPYAACSPEAGLLPVPR